ncbi:SPOSA6832_01252, partial [Sporobolomyces salmonicolor]
MAPKRPADSFSTAPSRAAAALSGKRVKFAPGNAEAVAADGDADDLELDLESGTSSKKKVVTDGYDSDSSAGSDGGFGGAGGGRAGKGAGGQALEPDPDEDDDMFGEGPGTDKGMDVKGKKKDKEFLEMGDIEGQEFGRGEDDDEVGEEDEEDYAPEDDLANNDDAPRSRRSKKGMGYALSSFNMKDELNEGRFSADGSYIANKADPLANHDTWLDGVSKASIRAAREAKARMDAKQKQREEEEARGEEQLTQLRDDCLIGLLALVREGETVAKALTRLGAAKKKAEAATPGGPKPKKPSKGAIKADDMELDDDVPTPPSLAPPSEPTPSERYAAKIERLTHLASTLLSAHGELEIYDQSYADIIKTLKAEGAVRRDWVPPRDPDLEKEEQEEAAAQAHADAEAAAAAAATSARTDHANGRSRVVIARPGAGGAAAPAQPQYYYRWNPPPPDQPGADQEFGPYDRAALESWIAQGYFGGDEAARILVRVEGEREFKPWSEISRAAR